MCAPLGVAAVIVDPTDKSKVAPHPADSGWYPGKYLGRKKQVPQIPGVAVTGSGGDAGSRACLGCRLGETPCEAIRELLMSLYSRNQPPTGLLPKSPAPQVSLTRGSLYGEGKKTMERTDGRDAHQSGYFEILNKSEFVFCIRVAVGG